MRQPGADEPATTIILCRHGESEGNCQRRFGGHSPTPLTERGREQARAAARRLNSVGVDVIYSSDLVRAAQTAAIIADVAGLQVHATSALRERSVGALTGLTFEEAMARYPDAFAACLRMDAHACPPGGESYAQCRARAAAFLDRLVVEHLGSSVLLVSHQLTLTQLLLHVLGVDGDRAAQHLRFQVDHCALHTLERSARGWRVIALNERVYCGPT